MKKLVNFSSGLLLSLLYCFALFSVAQPLPETFTTPSNHSEKQENVSKVSKSLFSLTTETENFSFSFNSSPGQFLKIPFFDCVWYPKLSEQLVSAQISQYTKYQNHTLVNYRKNDSIFPFHYFW